MDLNFEHNLLSARYIIFGSGKKTMISFHGFGQGPEVFDLFGSAFSKQYTLYALELFGHGISTYNKNGKTPSIPKEEFIDFMSEFFKENNISKFSIFSYSLGGKCSLCLLEKFHKNIDKVHLFAPDGIVEDRFYNIVSNNKLGNQLFKKTILNPRPLLNTINLLQRSKIIDPRMEKFLNIQLENRSKRFRLLAVWMLYKTLKPDIQLVAKNVIDQRIHVNLYYGIFDQIVPAKIGEKLIKLIPNNGKIHLIEAGHNLLNIKTRDFLIKNKLI